MSIETSHSETESLEISATASTLDEALSYLSQEVSRRGLNGSHNLEIVVRANHVGKALDPVGYQVGIFAQLINKSNVTVLD